EEDHHERERGKREPERAEEGRVGEHRDHHRHQACPCGGRHERRRRPRGRRGERADDQGGAKEREPGAERQRKESCTRRRDGAERQAAGLDERGEGEEEDDEGGPALAPGGARLGHRAQPAAPSARARCATATAARMLAYPVHRQMFPRRCSRTSSGVADGESSSRAFTAMIMPGVQKPHWKPAVARNASCTGWSLSSRARPSIVSTRRPRASYASTEQALTGKPSSS